MAIVGQKCKKGFTIQICKSAAGYYIGTKDENGMPNCRISGYSETESDASALTPDRMFNCMENTFCHGGAGCLDENL